MHSNPFPARILITGGSRGIGAACVRAFRSRGAAVAFLYASSADAALALAEETGAVAIRADVADRERVFAAAAEAREKIGPIDCLVNNAGIAQFRLFGDITQDEWQRMLDVNLSGPFFCTQAVLPDMIHAKFGRIINVSSIWGLVGASCEVHYSAAKAGLIGMTRALAKELGPSGITVNCVAPGVIDTDMNAALDGAVREALCEEIPLGSIGRPEDAVGAILYLAGAAYVTGQVISPNGGMVI